MASLIKTISADIIRFQLGGLVAVVVGAIDLFSGQRLGTGVDAGLLATGLAALGIHLADFAPSSTQPPVVKQ